MSLFDFIIGSVRRASVPSPDMQRLVRQNVFELVPISRLIKRSSIFLSALSFNYLFPVKGIAATLELSA